jgi:hypothetical protein
MRGWLAGVIAVGAIGLSGCTEKNPKYCPEVKNTHECPAVGDAAAPKDAGAEKKDAIEEHGDASDAVKDLVPEKPMCSVTSCKDDKAPICEVDAGVCRACTAGSECKDRSLATRGCDNGQCYECVTNTECTEDASKPICDLHACRACKVDAECKDGPGVCLENGKCAKEADVIHVQFNADNCPGADGTLTKPFCAPNDAVAKVSANQSVIVIHGPVNNQMSLNATLAPVVVVGKKNAGGENASIPVGVSVGVNVTAGDVLVRDLQLIGGTSAGSKGVAVAGTSTKLRLLRAAIATVTGLGIQADSGAALQMDRCLVEKNAAGGLLVNGASYDVTNSIFAMNGYGVKFNIPKAPTRFLFNTVVSNTGNAVTCDPSNAQSLVGSIISGVNDACTLDHSVGTAPTFDAARPYHLTAKLACPGGDPTMPPDHDFDGDARTGALDCGADQLPAK